MPTLGVSVYPDLRPLDEIAEYLRRAASYGYTRVFSSMFSVEGSSCEVLDLFERLNHAAHGQGMEVSLDVNPSCMGRLGATPSDLSVFAGIGADILRMDGAYAEDDNVRMLNNPYGMRIEYNASSLSVRAIESMVARGVDRDRILACHNFYPQRYTGFRWDRFLEVNARLTGLGLRVGAFVASHAPNSHGVWDATCGLPTVERLRDYPVDLQARVLTAAGTTDILFGNAYATDAELLEMCHAVAVPHPRFVNDEFERWLRESEFFDVDALLATQKAVRVEPVHDLSPVERKILFEFFPHVDMGDSSEWIWRSRLPRTVYGSSAVVPRRHSGDFFEVGDVVMVNDNYKHYAGEVQVVLIPIRDDGTRNLVGRICAEELTMFDAIHDGDAVVFLPGDQGENAGSYLP